MAISAQKFLPGSKGTAKSLPQAKISGITLTSQDKKNVNTIRVKTIQVDKILKGTLAADKKRLTDKKKEASKQRKDDVEAQLEKKPTKDGARFKMPKVLPKMGFLGWIKNFIGNILLGFFAVRLVEHLPKLQWVLKGVMAVGEFIIDWGGKILNALVTFVDWGYKLYDGMRQFTGNIFGNSGLKVFDTFMGALNKVLNAVLIIALAFGRISLNPFNRGKGGPGSKGGRGPGSKGTRTTSGGWRNPFRTKPTVTTGGGGGFLRGLGRVGGFLGKVTKVLLLWELYETGKKVFNPQDNIITSVANLGIEIANAFRGEGDKIKQVGGSESTKMINKQRGFAKGGKVKKPSRKFTPRASLPKKKRRIKKPVITPIVLPSEGEMEIKNEKKWWGEDAPFVGPLIKRAKGLWGTVNKWKDSIIGLFLDPLKVFGDKFMNVKFFGPILTIAVKSLMGQKLSQKDYDAVGVGLSSLINFGLNKGTLLGNIMSAFAKGGIVDPQIQRKEENVPKWISQEFKKSMESMKDDGGFWEKIKKELGIDQEDPEDNKESSSSTPDSATGASMLSPGSVPGGKLNLNQLVHLAKAAGASDSEAIRLASIAMYESGGNSKAHNPKYPDNSYGLWQINMLDEPGYMLGEERRNRYKLSNNEQLWDPARNASIALDILRTSGWSAWSTDKLVTQKDLDAAKTALNAPPPQSYPTSTKEGPALFPLDPSQNKSGSKLAGELGRFLDIKGLGAWGSGVHRHPEHPPWDPESGHRAGSLHYQSQGARAIDIGGWGPMRYKREGMSGTDDQTKIIEGIRAFERSKGGLKRVEFAHEGNDPSGLHDNHVHVAYHKGGEVPGRGERFAKLMGGEMVIDVDSAGPAKDLLLAINQASDRRGVMKAISDYAPYEAIQSRMIAVEKMVPVPVPMPVGSSGGGGMVVIGGGGEDPFSSLAAIG